MPPCSVSTWASAMRSSSGGGRLASRPSRYDPASAPLTMYFAKLDWSSIPTPSRTPRHSRPTASCQAVRRKLGSPSSCASPAAANHSGRSQPERTP